MQNLSSYETGSKPHKPDVARGKWSSKWDFIAANFGHAFGTKHFSLFPYFIFQQAGFFFIIPYIIAILTFSIPIYFIQSFIGQFSSSGTISAFRVAPLFKGLGYMILALNLMSASYYVVSAAVPLLYFFSSFNPTLPWMNCDNKWNTISCTSEDFLNKSSSFLTYSDIQWPSSQYYHFAVAQQQHDGGEHWTISWRVLSCTFIVWICIGAIVMQGVETMGKIIRYMVLIMFVALGIIFIRFLCVKNAFAGLGHFFNFDEMLHSWIAAPSMAMLAFGSGWGTVLTMASYNNFNEDIGKYSLLVNFGHLGVLLITGFCTYVADEYLTKSLNFDMVVYGVNAMDYIYIGFPHLFANMEASHFWALLFFLMLFIGEILGCVIQIFTILTAVFDEFEPVRIYKKEFTIVLLILLALVSVFFTFSAGFYLVENMMSVGGVVQFFVCFVELMVILWIYGRIRLQRDIKFMLGQVYPTWKVYLARFVTPLLLFLSLAVYITSGSFSVPSEFGVSIVVCFIIKLAPIIILPAYIIYKVYDTNGSFVERFKNLCIPNDWFPVDPEIRRRYQEYSGSSEIAHDLVYPDLSKRIDDMSNT